MQDGIYFDMCDEEYHSIKRLSSSGIKDLLESPTQFWFRSNLNPMRKDNGSGAMADGKLFHTMILEPENFSKKYKVSKNFKITSEERAYCKNRGLELIGLDKYEYISTLLDHLKKDGGLLEQGLFSGGYAEVSILWTDSCGVKKKCRIDYLGLGRLIDLKTFVKVNKDDLGAYISKYFFGNSVYNQLIFYLEGLEYAKSFSVEQVIGSKEQLAFWLDHRDDNWLPIVAFVNRAIPQAVVKAFVKESCPDLWKLGEKRIAEATLTYTRYLEEFGEKDAWVDPLDLSDLTFVDTDFPQVFYETLGGGYE